MADFRFLREQMVERQIAARAIRDSRLLDALRAVPRELFVPPKLAERSYDDTPLPIGQGQTISQPYIVALMIEALQLSGDEQVLDIGTGSGYAAAVLSRLAAAVHTVERLPPLLESARERFQQLGYDNIRTLVGDGSLGWPEHAPYQAIVVAAASPRIPPQLLDQLALKGRLVLPVGGHFEQTLIRETRLGEDHFKREVLTGVRFVPLVGAGGWSDE